jgi:hypothetical protein
MGTEYIYFYRIVMRCNTTDDSYECSGIYVSELRINDDQRYKTACKEIAEIHKHKGYHFCSVKSFYLI